jgi:hydroxypyruvate isomerase
MNRRLFLGMAAGTLSLAGLPGPAGADQEGKKGLRLSITWGMLGRRPVGEALALLSRLGYDAYEMFDWRKPRLLETFVAEREKSSLFCACLVANLGVSAPGCGLVNPREHEGFLRELEASIEPARKMNCRQLVVLTGNELGGVPRSEQMQSAVSILRQAAPILEKNGITAIVEILNTYVDHAGYFLYSVRDGVELVERVGSPNVKLLFDIYHVQIMEGNLIESIRRHIDLIGHFHVGDVPGRHEPGTGEINYRNVFRAIYEQGPRFQGSVALEYGPRAPLEEDMAAQRTLANFS